MPRGGLNGCHARSEGFTILLVSSKTYSSLLGALQKIQEHPGAEQPILELMADMGDKLGGEYIFDRQYVLDISEKVGDLVFKLISDLCVMTQNENVELFIAFERIQNEIQEELAGRRAFPMTRQAVLARRTQRRLNDEVGNKFANLGDIRNTLGLPTMDGFVITTKAFFDFMKQTAFSST